MPHDKEGSDSYFYHRSKKREKMCKGSDFHVFWRNNFNYLIKAVWKLRKIRGFEWKSLKHGWEAKRPFPIQILLNCNNTSLNNILRHSRIFWADLFISGKIISWNQENHCVYEKKSHDELWQKAYCTTEN